MFMPEKLIFTVTSGRSGTEFLTYQLGLLKNTTSLHEPSPGFESVMRAVQDNPTIANDFLLNQKIPFIKRFHSLIYIETSHLFCKGFLEPLINLGYVPDLILLRRNIRDIAKSLYALNTIPGRTNLALKYYLSPDDPSVFLPLTNWSRLDDYQLCFWYGLEIEERMKRYSEIIAKHGGQVAEITFEEVISYKALPILIKRLNLPSISILGYLKLFKRKLFSKRINPKTHLKFRQLDLNYNFNQAENEVKELIADSLS